MADELKVTRRDLLAAAARALALGSVVSTMLPAVVLARATPTIITVYKDPGCQCCTKWVVHLRENGFVPAIEDRSDMNALKDSMGVPTVLRSCHTAIAGKFVIEGHVPAVDVKRFLATPPRGMLGLAAPGMPSGSPGMEGPGKGDAYSVIAFGANGTTTVFARYG